MCEYYPEYMKNNRLQTQPYRWTAKDLDATFMQKLTDAEENAMLKRCASCEATELEAKLYSCLGCKHGECALSYYCSRKCQKNDWGLHKLTCGGIPETPKLQCFHVKASQKEAEGFSRRSSAIHYMIGWASWMILRGCSPYERSTLCVQFMFEGISAFSDPWILQKVDVVNVDWNEPNQKAIAGVIGVRPLCQLIFGGIKRTAMPMGEIPTSGCRHVRDYVPQWPWVVAQICALGNDSGWVATERLKFLLAVIQNPSPICQFRKWLNKFNAPMEVSSYPWTISRTNEWLSKMAKVLCF